jgi:signal transduction histidine kinase
VSVSVNDIGVEIPKEDLNSLFKISKNAIHNTSDEKEWINFINERT